MGTADADAGGAHRALFWIVMSGAIWAAEVLLWRFAAARGMGSFDMVAWTSVSIGAGGVLMLAHNQAVASATAEDVPYHLRAKMGCAAAGISWVLACATPPTPHPHSPPLCLYRRPPCGLQCLSPSG